MTVPSRSRRVHPTRIAMLVLVLLLILEILAFRFVGGLIGPVWTLLLVIATSAFGMWVIGHEGARARRDLAQALQQSRMPAKELADGVIVLIGGVLLLLPGFVSDVLGLLLVLPFTRPVTRTVVASAISKRVVARTDYIGGVVVTEVRRTDAQPPGPGRTGPPQGVTGPAPHRGDDVIEGEIVDDQPPASSHE